MLTCGVFSVPAVDGGHRAIIFSRITGVQKTIYGEGLHFRIPWFQYPIIYDIRARPKLLTSPTGSKDLQMVNMGLRVLFRPSQVDLPEMYRRLGLDYDERVLPSICNEVIYVYRLLYATFYIKWLPQYTGHIPKTQTDSSLINAQLCHCCSIEHIYCCMASGVESRGGSVQCVSAHHSAWEGESDANNSNIVTTFHSPPPPPHLLGQQSREGAALREGKGLLPYPG